MHSVIFEIFPSPEIKTYKFELCESSLYDELDRYGFDYVSEDTNRKENIEWLFAYLETKPFLKYGKDEDGYFIETLETSSKELTREIWSELNEVYKEYQNPSEPTSDGMLLYKMQKVISSDYSFRFWENGTLNTLQSMITDYPSGRFYIGNTLDYHY